MAKFPSDVPKARAIAALHRLGFSLDREGNHLHFSRLVAGGSRVTLALPNHVKIKGSTLRMACTQAGITRAEFLRAYLGGERD